VYVAWSVETQAWVGVASGSMGLCFDFSGLST
jgi:hypothetical protein